MRQSKRFRDHSEVESMLTTFQEKRKQGQTLKSISAEIGIPIATYHYWLRKRKTNEGEGSSNAISQHIFRTVQVLPETSSLAGKLSIMTPGGYRIEGLSLNEAAVLLKALA